MKLAIISGTPGCGKTSVAKTISHKIDAEWVSLNEIVISNNYTITYDRVRKTYIADFDKLIPHIIKIIKKHKKKDISFIIVESHYSDIVPDEFIDLAIVLRCDPDVLRSRLEDRNYPEKKVMENVQSEILGTCANYILEKEIHVPKLEIDTTDKAIEKVASIIIDILQNKRDPQEYKIGKIDWLEKLNKDNRLNEFFDEKYGI